MQNVTEYLDMDKQTFSKLIAESEREKILLILDSLDAENATGKVVNQYTYAQTATYWQRKDLDLVISISNKAEKYCRKQGKENTLLLSPVYYNLASFTLPWWSDSLPLSQEQKDLGYSTATNLLNLRRQNNDQTHKIAGALWMVAGHCLYAKEDGDEAIKYFSLGIEEAERSEDHIAPFMKAQCQEGIGRVHWILTKDQSLANQWFTKAEAFYKESEDNYSLGELLKFKESN